MVGSWVALIFFLPYIFLLLLSIIVYMVLTRIRKLNVFSPSFRRLMLSHGCIRSLAQVWSTPFLSFMLLQLKVFHSYIFIICNCFTIARTLHYYKGNKYIKRTDLRLLNHFINFQDVKERNQNFCFLLSLKTLRFNGLYIAYKLNKIVKGGDSNPPKYHTFWLKLSYFFSFF